MCKVGGQLMHRATSVHILTVTCFRGTIGTNLGLEDAFIEWYRHIHRTSERRHLADTFLVGETRILSGGGKKNLGDAVACVMYWDTLMSGGGVPYWHTLSDRHMLFKHRKITQTTMVYFHTPASFLMFWVERVIPHQHCLSIRALRDTALNLDPMSCAVYRCAADNGSIRIVDLRLK